MSRGLTQAELGTKVGASQRVIAYYESHEAQPPGAMLVDLAKALKATSDELLGLKPTQEKTSPKLKIADVHFQGGVGQCGLLTVGR